MKKFVAMLLALAMVAGWITIPPVHAHAEENAAAVEPLGSNPEVDWETHLTFELNKDAKSYRVSAYDGARVGDLSIPATFNGLPVTVIGSGAFEFCEELTGVIIPEGITVIESCAFAGCESLSSVTIPNGVMVIGDSAFADCYGLVNINIPVSVTSIGNAAFADCYRLTNVTIPNGVTNLANNIFLGCRSLSSVTLPGSITVIQSGAFQNCSLLTGINIPGDVTAIGDNAFNGCANLTDVHFGGTEDAWNAMYIGSNNAPLLNANISFNGEGSSEPTVEPTTTPTEVTVKPTISVPTMAPTVVPTDAPTEPFQPELDWEKYLTFTPLGEEWYVISDCDESIIGDLEIPATRNGRSVVGIAECAFDHCQGLTSVVIPKSVSSIGAEAFRDCASLQNVTMLGVEDICEQAFYECVNLTCVSLGDALKRVREYAFSGCDKLTDVYFDDTAEQWSNVVFEGYNEPLLNANIHFADEEPIGPTEPSIGPTEPPVDPTGAPVDPTYAPVDPTGAPVDPSYAPVDPTGAPVDPTYAPVDPTGAPTEPTQPESGWESLAFTLNDDGQSYCVNDCLDDVVGKVVVPETYNGLPVTMIGEYAFSCCYGLTEVELPQTITVINYNAFSNCSSLQRVNLPDGLVAIAEWAFASCDLREIQIPANVEYIGVGAFNGCPLTGIWLDENNTYYANDDKGVLFSKDMTLLMASPYGLTGSYAIPDGVEYIGNNAFSNTNLSEVTFPDSVEEIGSGAFNNCYLTEIVIGSGVKYIATDAFANCEYLTAVTVPNSVISIDDYAFQYSPNVTFYCHVGAYAATYADDFDIPICYLDAVKEVSIVTMPEKLIYPLDGHLKLAGLSLNVTLEDDTVVTLYNGYAVGAYDFSTAGTKTVTVSVNDKSVSFEVMVDDQLIEYPESNHPYQNNSDITWKFTYPGDADILAITFSQDTMVERNFDYIYIVDSEGNETRYTGRELAGKKIFILGKIFTVRLTSDSGSTNYGFAITSIEVLKKVDIDKVTFTPNSDGTGYIVTDCDESVEGLLEIPAEYEGLPVVGIGENAFQNCSELQEITIPISISAIGNAAFSGCNKLTDVYYGSSRKQWNTIQMGEGNEIVSAVTLHFAYCEDEHTPGDSAVVDEWGGNSCLDTRYQSVATYCLDCGIEIERERVILPPKGHTPGEPVIENEWTGGCTECGGYQKVIYCTECNDTLSRENVVTEPAGHIVRETVLLEQPATCNTKGYREWQTFCATCGYVIKSVTEEIPATGHTPGRTEADRTDPTCDTNGYIWTRQYCADCDMQIGSTYEVLPATDHIPGEVQKEIVNEGSCTNDRVYWNKVYCQSCWRTLSADYVVEKATGHTPGEPVKENEWFAGCENAGHYDEVVYCTNEYCGMQLSWKQVTVPPIGHTEEIIPGYAPTCTESGMTDGKYCTTCGQTIWWQEEIERLGHTPAEPVFEDAEGDYYYSVIYCSVCNAELHRLLVAICKHENQTTVFLGDPATCTEPGVAIWEVHCVDCGEILSSDADEIPATGHINTTETVTTVDATCTTAGSKTTTVTCACGEVVSTTTETIEALGHSYTNYVADGKGKLVAECDNGCGTTDSKVDPGFMDMPMFATIDKNGKMSVATKEGAVFQSVIVYYIGNNEWTYPTGDITWSNTYHKAMLNITLSNDAFEKVNSANGYRQYTAAKLAEAPKVFRYGNYVIRMRGKVDGVAKNIVQVVNVQELEYSFGLKYAKDGKIIVGGDTDYIDRMNIYYIGDTAWNYGTGEGAWYSSYHKYLIGITKSTEELLAVNGTAGYRGYGIYNLPRLQALGNYVINLQYTAPDGTQKNIVYVKNIDDTIEAPLTYNVKIANNGKVVLTGNAPRVENVTVYYFGETEYTMEKGEVVYFSDSLKKYLLLTSKANPEGFGAMGYQKFIPDKQPVYTVKGNYVFRVLYTDYDGVLKSYMLTATY